MGVKDLLSTYIKIDSANYPETLAAMVIINAPMWFSGAFSAVKSFLNAETQKKIQVGDTHEGCMVAIQCCCCAFIISLQSAGGKRCIAEHKDVVWFTLLTM